MDSPCIREATQLCFQRCCPTPFPPLNHHQTPTATAATTTATYAARRSFTTTTTATLFPDTEFNRPDSLPSLQDSFSQFMTTFPQYQNTYPADEIRTRDFYHLSLSNHVCLDYIGIGLFSFSQIHQQLSLSYPEASTSSSPPLLPPPRADLPGFSLAYKSVNLKNELGNGGNGSELQFQIMKRISSFLNVNEEDFSAVLTTNRASAFRLLAESYPFQSCKRILTVFDHESEAVEAMIGSAERRGAQHMAAEFIWPRLRIHSKTLKSMIIGNKKRTKKRGLLVFQLQSRVTGARYSYQWMKLAQDHGWHVVLDACALGPKDMDALGLSLFQPDFLVCSFYKVFGENPSGFGCLFVKKSVVSILESSTIGGIVNILPAKRLFYLSGEEEDDDDGGDEQKENGEENKKQKAQTSRKKGCQIECRCLDHVDSLGLSLINSRGRYLINWLINALMKLQHPNKENKGPLVKIYGPKIKFDRGPALAFNVFDWKGEKIEPVLVQKLADRKNISLSYSFLHNIYFPEKYEAEKGKISEKKEKYGSKRREKEKEYLGVRVVVVALSFLANFADVYRLWVFIAQFLDADFVERERWRYSALNQGST